MKRIGILGLAFDELMFTCCTARADGGNIYAVVHNPDAADRLNLRAVPNKKAESLGKYYNGVEVQILEELNNGWVRVRIGNRGVAEGYMMKRICNVTTRRRLRPLCRRIPPQAARGSSINPAM